MNQFVETTLCYLEKDGCYLMLHRNKKTNDINHDLWIGLGGKLEKDETVEACLLREIKEESGLTLSTFQLRGKITFKQDGFFEIIYLYTANGFSGNLSDCDEGELCWVKFEDIKQLPLWEGDRIFLDLLIKQAPYFELELIYQQRKLVKAILNNQVIK